MKGCKGSGLHMITFLLLIVGGLNWLLVGAFQWDIGSWFGGMDSAVSRVIYVLVGLSALYELAMHKGSCCCCSGKCKNGEKGDGKHCSKCGHQKCQCS